MTSERYKWGDEITLDDQTPGGGVTYNMTALNTRIANAAYAQALADVDAAAEKLGRFGVEPYSGSVYLHTMEDDDHIATAPTLTQAILSTGGE